MKYKKEARHSELGIAPVHQNTLQEVFRTKKNFLGHIGGSSRKTIFARNKR
jgi:hypothetical protein